MVFGRDGKPTKIVCKSDIFEGHVCYKVTFEDGETIVADADHIWRVMTKNSKRSYNDFATGRRGESKYSDLKGYFDLTTKDMVGDYASVRADGRGIEYKYRVPMNQPVEYARQELPVNPYV